jgi:H+/Cl- antiporter ClcA
MKAAAYSVLGALIGLCVTAAFVYFAGLVVDALGVTLYHSEADQQRNFNVALVIVAVSAVLGAWLGYRRAKKPRQHTQDHSGPQ